MRNFERLLITEWRRLGLPAADGSVSVAVSGGADSLSLLLALHELKVAKKLDMRLVAAHFNHRLRDGESDDDEDFVRKLVSERKIELAVGRSEIKPQANIEQIARLERYRFLQQTAKNLNAFAVLTAHTVDDQAETFLLNLIRGSGVQGLSAMRPVRALGGGIRLVRPLLRWASRADTEGYCHELGVDFRFDTMNEDEAFTRVRIRKILLPLLKDFNPKIVERLAETARLLQLEFPPDDERTADGLDIAGLKALPEGELKQSIRVWISANRGGLRGLGLKHIEAIERLIRSRKSGRVVELPGGAVVVKEGGKLNFRHKLVEKRDLGL
jgi:tRNA(Ile)-lysidine synthase